MHHVLVPWWSLAMSRQGRRDFLGADGVEEWVVPHGGAAATYAVGSIAEASALASEITQVPGVADSGLLLTLSDRRLTVRLTRGVGILEPHDIDLARAISEVARRQGAVADRGAVREVRLALAARPDDLDVDFWRAVLGYHTLADDNGVDPLGHGLPVWMQDLDPAKPARDARRRVGGARARRTAPRCCTCGRWSRGRGIRGPGGARVPKTARSCARTLG
jgi:4a-hydroxytetrahydrobiopterin dehydratase